MVTISYMIPKIHLGMQFKKNSGNVIIFAIQRLFGFISTTVPPNSI